MMMVYLMSIGSHTGGDDMEVIVGRVVMGIDKQRLSLFGIAHLLEVAVRNVEELPMRVFRAYATDCDMKLWFLDIRVPG